MIFNEGPGLFIVLEGLDGAGTTTQARLLQTWLSETAGATHQTQEPSPGPAGAQIRSILTGRLKTDSETLALLFATDRLDHLHHARSGITRLLNSGCHVICDRYYLSSLAYQSMDVDFNWVYQLNSRCVRPDLTLFLQVPVETCIKRITVNRGFHYELYEKAEKLARANEYYNTSMEYLQQEGECIHIVRGDLPLDTVHRYIKERVSALIDPERLTLSQQQDLLSQVKIRPLSLFVDIASREGLFLLYVRAIKDGYQAVFASSRREKPISVIFFPGTGRIQSHGPLNLQPRLQEMALEAQSKMYAGRLF